ncbi:galactokinase [Demequina sp. TTPB684]|uniref:galactokinase n=1 Tax=unclassified Demequina TaxID=2620311 RepID=UPI001CF1B9C2|nr:MULTISPECIES: galactokinase [unclassified Demequina]MCB2413986.1 galactokinase [Demequina sp. TTPB684]UPU89797.1 galactokinase [Demequina sp. TMPB413]
MTVPSSLADHFASLYGAVPEGVWSAPGRANLIGEHTDYNNGYVLPFAIAERTWCAARLTDTGELRVSSTAQPSQHSVAIAEIADATFEGWSGYALGVAWAFHEAGHDLSGARGVDILVDSTVPLGAGLSSSAALESAVAVTLNDLWGLGLDRMSLARAGQRAENGAIGAPTGIMDQVASLFGQSDHAVLLDCASLHTATVPLKLEPNSLALVVIDSRVKHAHANGGYASRREACERGAAALGVTFLRELTVAELDKAKGLLDDETFRRVRHVVTENARVLDTVEALATAGPQAIGDLLLASHASMRDDFEISVPQIDVIVDAAMTAGAVGARLTGGGFGGSAVALVPAEKVQALTESVHAAAHAQGFTEPAVLTVNPSQGARRDL